MNTLPCPHCHEPIELLTTDDVAAELGLERTRVQQLARARSLGTALGRQGWRVFTRAEVEAMHSRRPGRPRKER